MQFLTFTAYNDADMWYAVFEIEFRMFPGPIFLTTQAENCAMRFLLRKRNLLRSAN